MGGHSSRFGSAKGNVGIDDMPQWLRLEKILQKYCTKVFFSLHSALKDEYSEIPKDRILYDESTEQIGPMGGLYTSLKHTNSSCIFLSVDWFCMNEETIAYLCEQHNPHSDMTGYVYEKIQVLCAIYEPSILPHIQESILQKEYSIHTLLQNSLKNSTIKCQFIEPVDEKIKNALTRINTREELAMCIGKGYFCE